PELVVVVVLDAGAGEEAVERLEVLVRDARAAVQEEHLEPRVVADALRPDLERALRRRDWNHLHAAAEHVVAARVVEVARGSGLGGGSDLAWAGGLRFRASHGEDGAQARKQAQLHGSSGRHGYIANPLFAVRWSLVAGRWPLAESECPWSVYSVPSVTN